MKERILVILITGVFVLGGYTVFARAKVASSRIAATVAAPEMSLKDVGIMQLAQTKSEGAAKSEQGEVGHGSLTRSTGEETAVEWGSDPFVRDWILVSEVANLNLRAITVSPTGASALINDQILQVGDEISGKKVIRIDPDQVTLEQGGRTFTLTLGE